ncbi:hypothetical protein ACFQ7O_35695 [Streptomyces sp. NPDC056485]|uniref:hypothetical protein n=1 Tax=Streptomyces sp. NPDC056485 TaxID=3345834 RepID=UPI0036CC09C7
MSKTRRSSNGRFVRVDPDPETLTKALQMRGQGVSYARIAGRLNLSKTVVFEMVQAAYAAVVQDSGPVALALELDRLDEELTLLNTAQAKVLRALNRPADVGEERLDAVAVALTVKLADARGRIAERRAKLRGLDAPQTIRVEDATGIPVHEVLRRVAEAVRPYPEAAAAVSAVLVELAQEAGT